MCRSNWKPSSAPAATADSVSTAHALLGTQPVGFQRLGISQHRRDLAQGMRTLLGDLDQTAPTLKVIDTKWRGNRADPAVGNTWLGPAQ